MANPDYPLLVFPAPADAERAKRSGGGGKVRLPEASRQGERLAPQLQRLQEALAKRRVEIRDNALGIEPELALVLETVGPVGDFIRVAKNVRGLEWLGEYALDDIPPADGFEDESDPGKSLKGQLFLLMSDQRALEQLRNLFESWRRHPEKSFPRGLVPLKHAFEHLHAIRHWGVEDRLRETGLLEDWQERISSGQQIVAFEAELWYRRDAGSRRLAEDQLRKRLKALGGNTVSRCEIAEIAYHAILGRIDIAHVQEFLDQPESHRDFELFRCEQIMFVRPVGQCATPIEQDAEAVDSPEPIRDVSQSGGKPIGAPVVALLDGLPLTQHELLRDRLIVDDPDGYEEAYQAQDRSHGTSMASLICHDDLAAPLRKPMARRIYVRPIMKPLRRYDGGSYESIPEDTLPVDIVHRAVVRLFKGEGEEPPASPDIRVINLSIGDPARPFLREMSAWARLLDWLAWKYNILFLVSAGNHAKSVELDISTAQFDRMGQEDRQRLIVQAVATDTRNRRLLSPAETLNGLTVGAVHEDYGGSAPNPRTIILESGLPSVISAHGPGYRRAIKPDVFLSGGRQALDDLPNAGKVRLDRRRGLGQRAAAPGSAGTLNATRLSCGTSNATALASRSAYFFFELLDDLRGQFGAEIPREFDAVLMKTLLVHGAEWDGALDTYRKALGGMHDGLSFREYVGRFLGYGRANVDRVMACGEQRVTVMGFSKLQDGEGAEFALPLPPDLASKNMRRRTTVTLAWISPINSQRQNYRVAHLWFECRSKVAGQRLYADFRAAQRGTVQHEVFEGKSAVDFQDGDEMIVKVSCRKDAGEIAEPIRFGLAVTLEVLDDSLFPIRIYEEVRQRLDIRVRQEIRAIEN